MGFSRQEYWSSLPFPSPVDHILSDLSTMTRPSWVDPQAWLSFTELDKAVVLVWLDWLVFCDYGFNVSALLQHLLSYLGFSYLGRGYLFTAAWAKRRVEHGWLRWGTEHGREELTHVWGQGTQWERREISSRKLEIARVNINILGISELRWTVMSEFNSDDHYIYYCGQNPLEEME